MQQLGYGIQANFLVELRYLSEFFRSSPRVHGSKYNTVIESSSELNPYVSAQYRKIHSLRSLRLPLTVL